MINMQGIICLKRMILFLLEQGIVLAEHIFMMEQMEN